MLSKRLAPKHQKLIKQCYPPGRAPEKRPNASELSYLLYYASTRKVKLSKVTLFLEKSVRSDLYKERVGNVQVTLDILDALIDRCYPDLNLFADNVVDILNLVISQSMDISLCQHACQVFKTFCKYHDGALFSGSDTNYVAAYHDLVANFAKLPEKNKNVTTPDSAVQQWELIAIEAAEAVSSSPAMNTPAGQVEIAVLVPLALQNLNVDNDGSTLLELQWHEDVTSNRNKRVSTKKTGADWNFFVDRFEGVEGDSNVNMNANNGSSNGNINGSGSQLRPTETSRSATSSIASDFDPLLLPSLHTLTNLLDSTVGSQVRKTSHQVLKYILENGSPPLWSTTLVGLMALWTPVQLRFIIVSCLVDTVDHEDLANISHQLIVVKLVCSLLSSAVNMVGLSVMDILRTLISHQHKILHRHWHSSQEEQLASDLVKATSDALSALATHIYYGDQVADMISEALSFIHSGGAAEIDGASYNSSMSGPAGSVGGEALMTQIRRLNPSTVCNDLHNVRQIVQVASSTLSKGVLTKVPLAVWLDTDLLLTHVNSSVAIDYANTFGVFLSSDLHDASSTSNHIESSDIVSSMYDSNTAIGTMIQVVTTAIGDPQMRHHNYVAAYLWFKSVIVNLRIRGVLRTLPHCLNLYEAGMALERSAPSRIVEGTSLCSLALSLLECTASTLNLKSMHETVSGYISDRQAANFWIDVTDVDSDPTISTDSDFVQPIDRHLLKSQFLVSEVSDEVKASLFHIESSIDGSEDGTRNVASYEHNPLTPTIPELLVTRSRSMRGSSISVSVMTDSPHSPIGSNGSQFNHDIKKEFSPRVSDLKKAITQGSRARSVSSSSSRQEDSRSTDEKVNLDQLLSGLNLGVSGLLTSNN